MFTHSSSHCRCNLFKQQQLSIMLLIERRLSWWRWLGRLSERHIWQKEWEDQLRTYLDVTMTQTTRSGRRNGNGKIQQELCTEL